MLYDEEDKPLSLYALIALIFLDGLACVFVASFTFERFLRFAYYVVGLFNFAAAYKMYTFKPNAPDFATKVYFAWAVFAFFSIFLMPPLLSYRLGVTLSILWSMLIVFWLGRKSVRKHYNRRGIYIHYNSPIKDQDI